MKNIQKDFIMECELIKDVIWYLKGSVDNNPDFSLNREHIKALEDAVSFIYNEKPIGVENTAKKKITAEEAKNIFDNFEWSALCIYEERQDMYRLIDRICEDHRCNAHS